MRTPLVHALAWALVLVISIRPLAPPVVAQPARPERPVLPTAEDLGPGWVELPWTLPTGGPDYPEANGWYAGPYGSRIWLQVSLPPERIRYGLWTQIAEAVEDRERSPLIMPESIPPDTPPIEGCSEVRRAAGLSTDFPVLPEAITSCLGSDAIFRAKVSGNWQGQEGVAGSDALIRLLLDTGSRSGTPTATEAVGDQAAVLPPAPPPASTAAMPGGLTRLVPDTLPLGTAACVPADDGVTLDVATLVTRFPGVPDAATTLQTLGWQDGVNREYRCENPPAGGVGSVDISVHQFANAAGASAAVPYFANARAKVTQLASAPASQLGDTSAALSGPTVQGTESTLYVSSGPLLFRVTGIAPEGNPTSDVETIMAALVRGAGSDQIPSQPPTISVPTATATPSQATTTPTYTIVDLGTGDGNRSYTGGINEWGQVLWTWGTDPNPADPTYLMGPHPMLWQNGTDTDLSIIDLTIAINDHGAILAGKTLRIVIYQSDTGTVSPPLDVSWASDINNAGVVVGDGVIVAHGTVEPIPVPQGFKFVHPAAINEAGQVVGSAANAHDAAADQRAFLYADGIVTVLPAAPGAASSYASDVNDEGQVVGGAGLSWGVAGRAFLYDQRTGQTTDIGALPGYLNSNASAINNLGQVVGMAWDPVNDAEPMRRAYLYDHRAGVMTDLNQLIPQDSGWYLVDAADVNDAGQIVGQGFIGGEMHAFVLTPAQ